MLDSSTGNAAADPEPVRGGGRAVPTGLRERKKQQTRTRIIEVALELCDAHGFEATTVEQIADAADVSPRTVNRYFEIKEDIILGPVEDFGQAVAARLRAQPTIGNPLQALCDAFLDMVEAGARADATEPISLRRFQKMQRIAASSPAVSTRAMEFHDRKSEPLGQALAERLDIEPGSLTVRLAVATWQMMCHIAFAEDQELILSGEPEAAACATRKTVLGAFAELRRLCCVPTVE
ncbi:TetR/AcrR family transcriptional regulator [Nocardia sp. NPDC050712]|uniref:TetR/AcrR family transcriptional regulator n=1 Tax=Nocardia sp. NPDC050712 TaxID=3155518 RepID=UPI0033D81732